MRAAPWWMLAIAGVALFGPLVAGAGRAGQPPPAARDSFAVATENAAATRAAIDTLRAGGSAADAAVAACLVMGVVNPTSSGIGGGGFALVWDAATARATALDFREVAPHGIDPRSLDQRPVDEMKRGALVGVPGEVAGLVELHKRWGRRTFRQDADAAIRAARDGFTVERHMASALRNNRKRLQMSLALVDLFFRRGAPLDTGARATNPRLARTLDAIASSGPSAFYAGPVAAELARLVQAYGGALQEADLAAYRVAERPALHVSRDGLDVFTMPPPSAGGLLLAQTLLLNDRARLASLGADSPAYIHLLAESFRGAVADRMRFVGDPAFAQVPVADLLSEAHLGPRRAMIAAGGTHPPPSFRQPEHGTMHMVVVDRDRNVVSLTSTVNDAFGARIVAPEAGVLLNDELDDFTPPDAALAFGLAGGGPNAPRPGARPTSSMTPVIVVEAGRPILAAGGSGGTLIPTNVTQSLLRMTVFDASAQRAVSAPRFGVRMSDGALMLEPSWLGEAQVAALRAQGEQILPLGFPAAVQAVRIRPDGRMEAGADPRKFGSAAVVR